MIRVPIHCTTALHVIKVEIKNIQIALYICTYNIAFRCESEREFIQSYVVYGNLLRLSRNRTFYEK